MTCMQAAFVFSAFGEAFGGSKKSTPSAPSSCFAAAISKAASEKTCFGSSTSNGVSTSCAGIALNGAQTALRLSRRRRSVTRLWIAAAANGWNGLRDPAGKR